MMQETNVNLKHFYKTNGNHLRHARRGQKRKSYADADEIYRFQKNNSLEYQSTPSVSTTSEFLKKTSVDAAPGFLSQCFLRSLWIPWLSRAAVCCAENLAYAAYIGGQHIIYERQSPINPFSPGRSTISASDLYMGKSKIHGRGLFSRVPLRCGSRLPLNINEPRFYVSALSYLLLFSDIYDKLPDILHYTHPTGRLLEILYTHGQDPQSISLARNTQIKSQLISSLVKELPPNSDRLFAPVTPRNTPHLAHWMMNHSCQPNVCSGLSEVFWEAALDSDILRKERHRVENSDADKYLWWSTKIAEFHNFGDANAFFVTRDISAHEELTLDYGCRSAPLYKPNFVLPQGMVSSASQKRKGYSQAKGKLLPNSPREPALLCRCNAQPSSQCRRYLYQHPRIMVKPTLESSSHTFLELPTNSYEAAVQLFASGFDDEIAVLSLLPSSEPLLAYLSGKPLLAMQKPKFDAIDKKALLPPKLKALKTSKSTFLRSYRYIFSVLNNLSPV